MSIRLVLRSLYAAKYQTIHMHQTNMLRLIFVQQTNIYNDYLKIIGGLNKIQLFLIIYFI